MSRRCMRPGCDRPAVARLSYDPVACELWLDPLAAHGAPVQELCEFHVERLTVPRGWKVEDRREPAGFQRTAGIPAPEPSGETPKSTTVEEHGAVPEPEQAASSEGLTEPLSAEELRQDPEESPEEPRGSKASDRSPKRRRNRGDAPLLERAFAWTGPQQSILTQPRRGDQDA